MSGTRKLTPETLKRASQLLKTSLRRRFPQADITLSAIQEDLSKAFGWRNFNEAMSEDQSSGDIASRHTSDSIIEFVMTHIPKNDTSLRKVVSLLKPVLDALCKKLEKTGSRLTYESIMDAISLASIQKLAQDPDIDPVSREQIFAYIGMLEGDIHDQHRNISLLVSGALKNIIDSENPTTNPVFLKLKKAEALGLLLKTLVRGIDGKSEGFWTQRAFALIDAVSESIGDDSFIRLHGDRILDAFMLNNIMKASKSETNRAVQRYLAALPGFEDGQGKQSSTTCEQHSYLTMHLSRPIDLLISCEKKDDEILFIDKPESTEVPWKQKLTEGLRPVLQSHPRWADGKRDFRLSDAFVALIFVDEEKLQERVSSVVSFIERRDMESILFG